MEKTINISNENDGLLSDALNLRLQKEMKDIKESNQAQTLLNNLGDTRIIWK